jgi:hypothetical protein
LNNFLALSVEYLKGKTASIFGPGTMVAVTDENEQRQQFGGSSRLNSAPALQDSRRIGLMVLVI